IVRRRAGDLLDRQVGVRRGRAGEARECRGEVDLHVAQRSETLGERAAELLAGRAVEELDRERRVRELRGVHETEVTAVGSGGAGGARVAKAGDEDLVQSDGRRIRRDEAVPREAGEGLAGG